ncbi:zinc-dependent metalloprotease [Kordia sp. YSTF-M3]|uniref:Zinc-dependent metalloprotease n=1 Tax=Kordia aestuariivivens TaxID=2759037 RepID=A0ABR7Q813_9FLAO|nr:zinc-dependent metalloprotease [Kordia aestuariivivens]MBC8754633.1 zinc-dependent metalloprotease [Kordia aestuariivivens]
MKNYILLVFIFLAATTGFSQEKKKQHPRENYTGFFNFSYEEKTDKIFLEVDKLNTDFLYVYSLASGIGSNDIGLDRGQIGDGVVVQFQKMGNKLMLVQPNLRYRANTTNNLERKSVEQAFAKSVLFGFPIISDKKNKYIIDLTPFLLQDAHGVIQSLADNKQGAYKIDTTKSALSLPRTKAFPENVEFEALLTFKGKPKGGNIRSVTPNASLVSVTQHHSFVKLPDANYKPRVFDPRSGAISISYYDYATPIQEPMLKRFITRHRLEKKNPNAAKSEAKEPIIYYLDPGTPEPVRSALLDGARWWNEAYEEIGYANAFQVRMLPEDADPMDLRYNVIQWVHRSTRGWSYGASVVDPRTGEIIKGHVSLGSLRIRQDFLIAQALLNAPFANNDTNHQPMLEMALARIRQLSAHEVGHTIGFAHNFASSTNNRSSVMDYPHPAVKITNGKIDLSNAYATGIGSWDKVTVAYTYSEFASKVDEKQGLRAILDTSYKEGHRFISDADARPAGGAHANAHLWDNGKSAASALQNVLEVRALAIKNFSKDNIRSYEPYTVLEDVFVPLYFFHRYQTEATTKLIGGLDYNYATKNDGQLITKVVSPKIQREALTVLLKTLDAKTLKIPQDKLDLFPPRAYTYWRSRESFNGKTGVGFDAMSPAATASDMTLKFLFHPERAARLIQQKSKDEDQLSFTEMVNEVLKNTLYKIYVDAHERELGHVINVNVLKHLMSLANHPNASPAVKAQSSYLLNEINNTLKLSSLEKEENAYKRYYFEQIEQFKKYPEKFKIEVSPKIPDGSPIGSDNCYHTQY